VAAGTLAAGVFMLVTFGTAYREAALSSTKAAGGAWLLTPEQVARGAKQVQLKY
jgi:hypothetical protein